jgi:RimJ/RimL family protein N-acetyltransferase
MRDLHYFMLTERLGFSLWNANDIERAVELWGNPDVTRFITATGRMGPPEIMDRLGREIDMQVRFGVQYWPLFLREGGRFVGCCGLRPYDLSRGVYELGVHLLPMFWGKGCAREACARVIRLAFDDMGCPSLFAGHNPLNQASARLLLDLGFVHTHDELYPPTGLEHPSYLLSRDDYYSGV